jgi:hypothetical protein
MNAQHSMHVYAVQPRSDERGVDLISDALAFGRLWYAEPGRSQQCNRLREVLQPVTWCCDSCLR